MEKTVAKTSTPERQKFPWRKVPNRKKIYGKILVPDDDIASVPIHPRSFLFALHLAPVGVVPHVPDVRVGRALGEGAHSVRS